jgi:hypothetical protein
MDKIDVVYILRNKGTRWRNEEIRYSLRSIEKHLDFNNVFIVGELPSWALSEKITLIKADDPYGNKLRNAIHKITLACKDEKVSDNFILMNDDFFFLKKTEKIEYFNKGKLAVSKRDHSTKGGYYYRAICSTLDMLRAGGVKDPVDYEVHYPIIFNKQKFLKMAAGITETDYLFRSVYCNLNNITSKYRADVKVFNRRQLSNKKTKDLISIDEKMALDPVFQKFIMVSNPAKSQYEKVPQKAYFSKSVFTYRGKQYNPGDLILANDLTPAVIRENGLKTVFRQF